MSVSSYGYICFLVFPLNFLIYLHTLKEIHELTEEDLSGKFTPALNIYSVFIKTLEYYKNIALPEQSNKLNYVLNNTFLDINGHKLSLLNLIDKELLALTSNIDQTERSHSFCIPNVCETFVPIVEKTVTIKEVQFKYKLVPAVIVKGRTLDQFLLNQSNKTLKLKNAINEKEKTFSLKDLHPGFDTKLEAGKYYHNPKLDFYYYCETIKDETAYVYVVETYQHGRLIQMYGPMDISNAKDLIEVSDKSVLKRLKKRLAKLKQNPK